jgi:hypothetical protein
MLTAIVVVLILILIVYAVFTVFAPKARRVLKLPRGVSHPPMNMPPPSTPPGLIGSIMPPPVIRPIGCASSDDCVTPGSCVQGKCTDMTLAQLLAQMKTAMTNLHNGLKSLVAGVNTSNADGYYASVQRLVSAAAALGVVVPASMMRTLVADMQAGRKLLVSYLNQLTSTTCAGCGSYTKLMALTPQSPPAAFQAVVDLQTAAAPGAVHVAPALTAAANDAQKIVDFITGELAGKSSADLMTAMAQVSDSIQLMGQTTFILLGAHTMRVSPLSHYAHYL